MITVNESDQTASPNARAGMSKNKIGTPILVIAELADAYIRAGEEFGEREKFILSNSTIIPLTSEVCIEAARIKQEIRKMHKDFGLIDAMILVKQKEFNCKVISGDKHFKNLKNVLFMQ